MAIQILSPFAESNLSITLGQLNELCIDTNYGKKSLDLRKKLVELTLGSDLPDPESENNFAVFMKILFQMQLCISEND